MSDWDRPAEKQQVVDVVQAAIDDADDGDPLFGWQAFYDAPPGAITEWPDKAFIVGDMRGSADTAVMGRDVRTWNDSYILETGFRVVAGDDAPAANSACWAAIRAVFDLLFVSPRLDRGDHPMPDLAVHPGRLEGPNASSTDGTAVESLALLDISITRGNRGSIA